VTADPPCDATRMTRSAGLRVSRMNRRKEVQCCVRDEGRSLEAGGRTQASNPRKVLRPKPVVLSVAEKAGHDPVRYDLERRTKVHRRGSVESALDDAETGVRRLLREESGGRSDCCPGGIRHVGGASPGPARTWNVRAFDGDAKGEAQAGSPCEARVPKRRKGSEPFIVGRKVL